MEREEGISDVRQLHELTINQVMEMVWEAVGIISILLEWCDKKITEEEKDEKITRRISNATDAYITSERIRHNL